MSDAQFEEFLKRNVRDYNAPPAETPRDAMWEAIAEARATRRVATAESAATTPTLVAGSPSVHTRRPMRRLAPWIGMAATLLLGIGIGSVAFEDSPSVTQIASAPESPATNAAGQQLPSDGPVAATQLPAATPAVVDAPSDAAPAPRNVARSTTLRPAATRAEPNLTPVSLASQEHLQRAEALVSVVAATPADAVMDSLTGKWAREMLTNTRLLLDSPAGEDPVRRRLLEDLETVLVQLVQRSGARTEEREILDRTLQRTQLLTRLRSGVAGTI